MNNNLTDITVVLDKSGSMTSIKKEAESGLNHFIEEQKKLPGNAKFSLVEFDTNYSFVYKAVDIKEVGRCSINPYGMTALLDAVGKAINETGERLNNMSEEERPGLVVFVILTDGAENSSFRFTRSQIKEMIEKQQSIFGWQFTFLGANQDAFAEASSIGIHSSSTVTYTPTKVQEVFYAASRNVSCMREAAASNKVVNNSYTSEEINSVQ